MTSRLHGAPTKGKLGLSASGCKGSSVELGPIWATPGCVRPGGVQPHIRGSRGKRCLASLHSRRNKSSHRERGGLVTDLRPHPFFLSSSSCPSLPSLISSSFCPRPSSSFPLLLSRSPLPPPLPLLSASCHPPHLFLLSSCPPHLLVPPFLCVGCCLLVLPVCCVFCAASCVLCVVSCVLFVVC